MPETSDNYHPPFYKALVLSVLVGVMISILLFVLAVLENNLGHSIAIASFAATTVIVFLQSKSKAAQPFTIVVSYMTAALVGFLASFIPVTTWVSAGLGIMTLVFLLLMVDRMHPPAIAYALGFMIGGYGVWELFLTIPALLLYFIALGAVIVVVESVAVSIGWLNRPKVKRKSLSLSEKIEQVVSTVVPYALVVLFALLLAQYVYQDALAPYQTIITIIDWLIISLFILDLYFIYHKAQSTKAFVQANWLDILATVPFFVVIRFFQGSAMAFTLLARGASSAITEASQFVRLLRPLARIPRFTQLIKRIEALDATSSS